LTKNEYGSIPKPRFFVVDVGSINQVKYVLAVAKNETKVLEMPITNVKQELSIDKMRLLQIIEQRGEVTPAYLRWAFDCTATNISMHLRFLVEKGLIIKKKWGKTNFISLTDHGLNLMVEINKIIKDLEVKHIEKVKQDEMDRHYAKLLQKEETDMQEQQHL
jgi:DNA-binding MarR family transcriptional regulator